MQIIEGDLLDMFDQGEFDGIAHGCNCFHTMGAGIAKAIAERYPEVRAADIDTAYADTSKLGTVSAAQLPNDRYVFNLYTQFEIGPRFEYFALQGALGQMLRRIMVLGKRPFRLGLPWIGCGIGGGDRQHVKQILNAFESLYSFYQIQARIVQLKGSK